MKHVASLLLLLPLFGAATAAQAEDLRPGLWEHSMKVKNDGGRMAGAMSQMQQQMEKMPPEQRQMIEKMMADKGVAMGAQGTTVKVCMTKEDIARDKLPQREGCTQTMTRTADTWKVSFQCKGNPPSSGEGVMRMLSPTAYDGEFKMTTVVDGRPERMDMSQTGRWLSADCGALAPKKKP